MTVGRAGFDRVHRQDIAGWSFAFGQSHYQLVGPPGWVVGSTLLTAHPDYFTTILWQQIVGNAVLTAHVTGSSAARAGVELGIWCSAAAAPFGAGRIVMPFANTLSETVIVALPAALSAADAMRHVLTAPDGDLQADAVLLNGQPLTLTADGELRQYPIPGAAAPAASTITLPAQSYGFVSFKATAAACTA